MRHKSMLMVALATCALITLVGATTANPKDELKSSALQVHAESGDRIRNLLSTSSTNAEDRDSALEWSGKEVEALAQWNVEDHIIAQQRSPCKERAELARSTIWSADGRDKGEPASSDGASSSAQANASTTIQDNLQPVTKPNRERIEGSTNEKEKDQLKERKESNGDADKAELAVSQDNNGSNSLMSAEAELTISPIQANGPAKDGNGTGQTESAGAIALNTEIASPGADQARLKGDRTHPSGPSKHSS